MGCGLLTAFSRACIQRNANSRLADRQSTSMGACVMGRNDNSLPGVKEQWVGLLIRAILAAITALCL